MFVSLSFPFLYVSEARNLIPCSHELRLLILDEVRLIDIFSFKIKYELPDFHFNKLQGI